MNRPHPILCILPPYILDRIAESGSQEQRDRATHTLDLTGDLRIQRMAVLAAPSARPKTGVAAGVKKRTVFTADYTSNTPGRPLRAEGAPPCGDPAADEAYDGAGATYDLFWQIYQRDSVDGAGLALLSTVHYQRGYDNAFWDGTQMVYGDGDEDQPPERQLFRRFTSAMDVIGHELTHGVTQHTANLNYQGQSGALNESFSDVFGILVKQRVLAQQAVDADWIIGRGIFTPNVKGIGLRSMKNPGTAFDDPMLGKDPQPGHMSQFVTTTADSGGVHINSGIPNRAFYLVAQELGGYAWQKAGQIWYVALRDHIRPATDFQGAADATYTVAGDLFGKNSLEQQAVQKGWAGVGVLITNAVTPDPGPGQSNPGCLVALLNKLTGKG